MTQKQPASRPNGPGGPGGPTRPTHLFVLPWEIDGIGGVNQVVKNLALQMLQHASPFRPMVLVGSWSDRSPRWSHHQGIPVVHWRIDFPWRQASGPRRWLDRWQAKRFVERFGRFCVEHRVLVINPHFPSEPSLVFADVVKARGHRDIQLILSYHGTDVLQLAHQSAEDRAKWRRFIEDAGAKLVACSRSLADQLGTSLGHDVPINVIHNGIDAAEFVTRDSKLDLPSDRRYILSVASFQPVKGLDVLLRAFASLASEFPDIDLVLAGPTGEGVDVLRGLASESGLTGRVHVMGSVPHRAIDAMYRDAVAFALPSRREAFGLVLLGAGAFGLGCVASRVGGIPEIIEDGRTGLLFESGDADALAGGLRRLLNHPCEAKRLGAGLSRLVQRDFTWQAALSLYCALTQDRRSSQPC